MMMQEDESADDFAHRGGAALDGAKYSKQSKAFKQDSPNTAA